MTILTALSMLLLAPPAPAAEATPCTATRPALPPELAGWTTRVPLAAGVLPRNAPVLSIGKGADLALAPMGRVTPVAAPGKVPGAQTLAGIAMFQVARAGTYRVALGGPAWVDVVSRGTALSSVAHGHGPACSGIRKIVDFRLTPGRYILQLTGSEASVVPVLIARGAAA